MSVFGADPAAPATSVDTASVSKPVSRGPASGRPLLQSSERIGRGTFLMISSTLVFFVLSFVGRVFAARVLSVEAWGAFNLGVSFAAFLSVVILLGLNNAVARCLALERNPAGQRALIRWSLGLSAGLSVGASVATYLFAAPLAALFHEPVLTPVFRLLSVAVGLGAITPMFAAIFQGFHDMIPNAWINQVLNPAVFVVAILGLLYLHWGLLGALVAYLLSWVVSFIASVLYFVTRIERHLPRGAQVAARPSPALWSSTVALWGIGSLAFVTAYADTLILGAYRPATDVGFYSSAMALARTLLLGGAALTFVFLPLSARLSQDGELGLLRRWYTVSARWILFLCTPLFLLFLFLPGQSVQAIFGLRYLPAAPALQVLSVTGFVSCIVGPSNACLAGFRRDRAQLVSATLSGLLNVGLSFWLIPPWGVLGAAVAWGVARAVYPASNLVILIRDYNIHPFHPTFWRPLALTFGIATPGFLLLRILGPAPWVVYPMFFVGVAIASASLIWARSLLPDDLVFVRAAERLAGRQLRRVRALVKGWSAPASSL